MEGYGLLRYSGLSEQLCLMLDLIVIPVTASSIKGFNGQSERGHVSALILFPYTRLAFYFITLFHWDLHNFMVLN